MLAAATYFSASAASLDDPAVASAGSGNQANQDQRRQVILATYRPDTSAGSRTQNNTIQAIQEDEAVDSDQDGVTDNADNCIFIPNGPDKPDAGGNSQLDSDSDGYGNSCDPDFDNNLAVDFGDLAFMMQKFFTADSDADLDGNGAVDFNDLAILKSLFFASPGPSGLVAVEPPFGLDSRENLAAFNLPSSGIPGGTFNPVNAFPRLAFESPLFLAPVPGEDRLVVVEQRGTVQAFIADAAASTTKVVLDLQSRVLFAGEQGLLGLAFDPAFTTNRYIYVHYSVGSPRRSIIARFTWNVLEDKTSLNSEKVILELDQPFGNHNGGMLAFGPDDYLYIAFGDGGSGGDPLNHAQNGQTLHGTLLRIDVHPADPATPYAIPRDNPFIDDPSVRNEIYALGLRNPFRFSFDRQTGNLWVGDVGQGRTEEIDRVAAGDNLGWSRFEGSRVFNAGIDLVAGTTHTPPLHEYDQGPGIFSVIGGYVYRGTQHASLFGRYIFTDFGQGTIWSLDPAGGNPEVLTAVASPTSFGEDRDAELYVLSQGGTVFRFEEKGGSGSGPTLLSQTGLFTDLATLTPASGLVEYDLPMPLWSDTTHKRRWIGIPDGTAVTFTPTGSWSFPAGTVIVKHFEIDLVEDDPLSRRRLETRALVKSDEDWFGLTFRWNSAGTDATLLTGRESEVLSISEADGGQREQRYDYPSRTDCLVCHNRAAGFALGPRTRQLNTTFDYPATADNQLRSWNHIGLFISDIGPADQYQAFPNINDGDTDIETRARAYLDVNCAICHRPNGPAPVSIDLRFDTPLPDMNAVDVIPQEGDLGVTGSRIIASGDRKQSVLWLRMAALDDNRMPPLASHIVDQAGLELIGQWIDLLQR
jgi:uncharacterized repeat protein (TIGR03806 family)